MCLGRPSDARQHAPRVVVAFALFGSDNLNMTRSRVVLAAVAVLVGSGCAYAEDCDTGFRLLGSQVNGIYHIPAGDVRLPGGCTFRAQLVIARSNTTLDCNGSIFDGEHLPYRTIAPPERGARPVVEHASGLIVYAAPGTSTTNVVIRNCVFQNYGRDGHYEERSGWAPGINHRGGIGLNVSSGLGANARSVTADQGTYKVTIENTVFRANVGGGTYIRPHVHDVTIRDSIFQANESVAIYVELAHRIVIERNGFEKNGWRGTRRFREAIAIDAARDNQIVGNTFRSNGAGGIFLYRNCGEFGGPTRWQGSDDNLIRDNAFANEARGVWVASRQGANLEALRCSDKSLYGAEPRFRDYADRNKIEKNSFCDVDIGITVQGRNNTVKDNHLAGKGIILSMPVDTSQSAEGEQPLGNVHSKAE